jgi:hypothetical protein
MDNRIGEECSPKSNDLDGWRQAIADNRLRSFKLEEIAAAFQDLGSRDKSVQHALAQYLNDSVLGILRGVVGFNHPNRGEDIILRAHHKIFEALLRPKSADGLSLRKAFVSRVLFRMKDAIAVEQRERRVPIQVACPKADDSDDAEESSTINTLNAESAGETEGETDTEDEEEVVPGKGRQPLPLDSVQETYERIDVKRIFDRITDPRKRLAFYLYMNDFPYHSKKKGVQTIAQALNISDRTARDWVEEVRQFLENDEDIQYLKNGK